jgi:hypothetical protein
VTSEDETQGDLQYPNMRVEVLDELTALSDPDRQAAWGHWKPGADFYEDLTLVTNNLQDCAVPPEECVGVTLYPDEVEYIEGVWQVLDALITKLGKAPDSTYLADPAWPDLMAAARAAKLTLEQSDRRRQNQTVL